jgi:hypothetical protein
MKFTPFKIFVLSFLLFQTSGAFAKDLENIHVSWKPTTAVKPISKTTRFVERIAVEDFTDARKTPELLGEYRRKDSPQVMRVTTKDNMGAFITEGIRKSLENAGFSTVKTDAEISISGELRKYFVAEASMYKGESEIAIQIKNSQGQVLWNGVISGTQERWGVSYKADNYFEVLSDLVVNAVNTLTSDAEMQKALIKR